MKPLEQLAGEIADAIGKGYVPGPDALARWHELAQALLTGERDSWLSEPMFRLQTGASAKWCRGQFAFYERLQMARRDEKGRRVWHRTVRAKAPPGEGASAAEVKAHIVGSFKRSA